MRALASAPLLVLLACAASAPPPRPPVAPATEPPAAAEAAPPADADPVTAQATEIDAARFGDAAKYAAPGEGKGGIQPGAVRYYVADRPIRIYRVFSSSKPGGATGGWWSPEPPAGTLADYRRSYAICTAWNPELDRVVACDLKAGAMFAMGPGESVDGPAEPSLGCGDERYPDDAHLQIMLLRPVAEQLEGCDERAMQWDAAAPGP